jgi:thiamine-monophosphate kinase
MENPPQLVRDIGELGLLAKLQDFCPKDIVGDDGATIAIAPHHLLVTTTDVLVDGVHFSDRTTAPEDVGWRAAAANLSDLAAMGASPLGITVGLSLPGDVSVTWVERMYRGLTLCLQNWHTPIIGGDICRSSIITLAITALGQVLPDRVIRRYAARAGDGIVVTGVHGASRAGLELLLSPNLGTVLSEEDRAYLISAHQRPQPRLDVLTYLKNIERLAGMDSSDGLADAVLQICRCSGMGARLNRDAIAILPAISQLVSPQKALEWILYGGEDFELVLTLPYQEAEVLVAQLGRGSAIVGSIVEGKEVVLVDRQDPCFSQVLSLTAGFQHF